MQFGISTGPQHVPYAEVVRTWQVAEGLGFDSAWVFDHFMPIVGDIEGPCLESLTLLSALAVQTSHLRIGTLVLGNPYRHPAVLARMGATLDIVAQGRFVLGLGAGWHESEHAMYGLDLPPIGERISNLDGPGGTLPGYKEGASPLKLDAEASIGTYLSPRVSVHGEYARPTFDASAFVDFLHTEGHVDAARSSGFRAGAGEDSRV